MASPTLTVRLNNEIKDQMLSYPDTNWSAFVRMAIQKELERLQRSDASQLIEQVRAKLPEDATPAVELIRAMRQSEEAKAEAKTAGQDEKGTSDKKDKKKDGKKKGGEA